jgi:hypothetical protein
VKEELKKKETSEVKSEKAKIVTNPSEEGVYVDNDETRMKRIEKQQK